MSYSRDQYNRIKAAAEARGFTVATEWHPGIETIWLGDVALAEEPAREEGPVGVKWHLDEGPMDEEREAWERRARDFEVVGEPVGYPEDGPADYLPIGIHEAIYRDPRGFGILQ